MSEWKQYILGLHNVTLTRGSPSRVASSQIVDCACELVTRYGEQYGSTSEYVAVAAYVKALTHMDDMGGGTFAARYGADMGDAAVDVVAHKCGDDAECRMRIEEIGAQLEALTGFEMCKSVSQKYLHNRYSAKSERVAHKHAYRQSLQDLYARRKDFGFGGLADIRVGTPDHDAILRRTRAYMRRQGFDPEPESVLVLDYDYDSE